MENNNISLLQKEVVEKSCLIIIEALDKLSAQEKTTLAMQLATQVKSIQLNKAFLSLRFKVFLRDNFTCQYCGRTTKDNIKLQVDHILPRSKGGKDEFDNFTTSCSNCNVGKTDILLELNEIKKLKKKSCDKNYKFT